MKSKLIALVAFVLITQVSTAQFTIGAKVGANLTKIEGKSFKQEFKTGYLAGGFAMIGLGDKIGIQPEVLFVQTNTRTDTSLKQVPSDAFSAFRKGDVKLNYLSIPILLNYKFIGNFVTLQAGPQFGILMNKDQNLLRNGQNAFKNGDFSIVGGAQLKISKFVGSARYVVGLNNISDIDNQDKWRNQGIQLAVGISL
ncbi:MAG TPA: porin family protein [Chitinophagaceae bacterium]|jgi:hypothetical protein|nr:porin family protein [Chitinophagaceae bacterium]